MLNHKFVLDDGSLLHKLIAICSGDDIQKNMSHSFTIFCSSIIYRKDLPKVGNNGMSEHSHIPTPK